MIFPAIRGTVMVPFSEARESAIRRATDAIMGCLAAQNPRTLTREAGLIHFTATGFRLRFWGPGYTSRATVLDVISAGQIDIQAMAGQLIVDYRLHFTPLYVLSMLTFAASLVFLLLLRETAQIIPCLLWLAPLFVPAILGVNILIAISQFRRFLYRAARQ